MTDQESQFSPTLEAFLSSRGIQAIRIPECNSRTPDYRIPLLQGNSLLELKIKSDDPEKIRQSHEAMAAGGIGTRSKALRPTNTISGVISDGAKQMIEYDSTNAHHHLLWLHASGYDATAHSEQLLFTLYGCQRLVSTERKHIMQCYFFHNSEFWRHRKTLAGAFVSNWSSDQDLSIQLCINPHYSRKDEFSETVIHKAMKDGLLDVQNMDDGIDVLLVDGECDRKYSQNVLKFLRLKYGLNHLQTFNMGYQYAGMWEKRSPEEIDL